MILQWWFKRRSRVTGIRSFLYVRTILITFLLWSRLRISFPAHLINKQVSLKEALLPPLVVSDSMKALNVLERFKRTGIHLALVLDEYGSVQGLITLADLLEALMGDIPHIDELIEHDTVRREDCSGLLTVCCP